MAKRPTINTLTNTASPTYLTQLNQNFTNVQTQFDNTLSLDGSTPNAMNADIDLNGNDLLNAGSVNTATLRIGGVQVSPNTAVAVDAVEVKKEFTTVAALLADTSTYTFFAADDYVRVLDGNFVYKVALSGASDNHVTTAGGVKLYVQAGTSGYHVKAFGAKGDGTTNDTTAIQKAITAAQTGGGQVSFEALTYIISTLVPKSNVTLRLNGATLKQAAATYERIFDGSAGGTNFAVIGGTLDGNKANNAGNYNLSGASNFVDRDGLTFKNVSWQNIYRASLILDGATENVLIEDVSHSNCGQANAFSMFAYGLECYSSTRNLVIKNFTVSNHYGFGIHFYECTDFVADNLLFDTLTYGGNAIAITWTMAKRGRVSNVRCVSIDGDALECNASQDQLIENVNIESAGDISLLVGDNNTGIYNERVTFRNVKITSTGGTYSVRANMIKNCRFEGLDTDKTWDTTVSGNPANDRNNVIEDSVIAANLRDTVFTYNRKFHLKRVRFSNFYVHDHDGYVSTFSSALVPDAFGITVANGATTYVDFNAFNAMLPFGFVCGRLRVTSAFNNAQGSYHECTFLASNNNTTLNLSSVTRVDNAVARAMTIAADAANRRISITNSTGASVSVFWTVELHKADV